ncbi:S-adenosyl-L-methionine-dependent methyltransferase [Triangularia setosa]|uniref:S-adenosyl-L-methionine-dependent methyltransferase n=1 Tax=Triangularia setosa TaxID=2587417 RepID=A0AAN6WBP5_9PEZI|nr:S-adenosyl-L-methionine-dependent methyltransferase [Podospora setosa]
MSSTSSFQLPKAAGQGFQNASAYDTHRPSYPQEAVTPFLSALELLGKRNAKILEIAAGTGKFTELLANRDEEFNVTAVEPHGDMRGQLNVKGLKGVNVRDGHAGRLPAVEQEWADGYIAAQSFHWFANEGTLREAHRVLKNGAGLGAIWNIEDYNKPRDWKATTKWEEKLNSWIYSISSDGQPRFRDGQWRDALENQKLFALPLNEETVKWTVWLSEEALWSRINTLSQVVILEGSNREAAVKVFKDVLRSPDVERNDNGEIALHGVTYFVWTKKFNSRDSIATNPEIP